MICVGCVYRRSGMERRGLRVSTFPATSKDPYSVLLSVLEARHPPGSNDTSFRVRPPCAGHTRFTEPTGSWHRRAAPLRGGATPSIKDARCATSRHRWGVGEVWGPNAAQLPPMPRYSPSSPPPLLQAFPFFMLTREHRSSIVGTHSLLYFFLFFSFLLLFLMSGQCPNSGPSWPCPICQHPYNAKQW